MPLNSYREEDIKNIINDPLYKEFLEFKNEVNTTLSTALNAEIQENKNDMFKYQKYDPYFGEYESDDWNSTPFNWNMNRSTRNN